MIYPGSAKVLRCLRYIIVRRGPCRLFGGHFFCRGVPVEGGSLLWSDALKVHLGCFSCELQSLRQRTVFWVLLEAVETSTYIKTNKSSSTHPSRAKATRPSFSFPPPPSSPAQHILSLDPRATMHLPNRPRIPHLRVPLRDPIQPAHANPHPQTPTHRRRTPHHAHNLLLLLMLLRQPQLLRQPDHSVVVALVDQAVGPAVGDERQQRVGRAARVLLARGHGRRRDGGEGGAADYGRRAVSWVLLLLWLLQSALEAAGAAAVVQRVVRGRGLVVRRRDGAVEPEGLCGAELVGGRFEGGGGRGGAWVAGGRDSRGHLLAVLVHVLEIERGECLASWTLEIGPSGWHGPGVVGGEEAADVWVRGKCELACACGTDGVVGESRACRIGVEGVAALFEMVPRPCGWRVVEIHHYRAASTLLLLLSASVEPRKRRDRQPMHRRRRRDGTGRLRVRQDRRRGRRHSRRRGAGDVGFRRAPREPRAHAVLVLELLEPRGVVDLGLGLSERPGVHARLLLDLRVRNLSSSVLLVAEPVCQRLVNVWDFALGLFDGRVAALLLVEPLVLAAEDFGHRARDLVSPSMADFWDPNAERGAQTRKPLHPSPVLTFSPRQTSHRFPSASSPGGRCATGTYDGGHRR